MYVSDVKKRMATIHVYRAIADIEEVGGIPFYVLEPVLSRCVYTCTYSRVIMLPCALAAAWNS